MDKKQRDYLRANPCMTDYDDILSLLDHIDALERQVRAEAEANNVIDVDGLRVGVCTVRAYREQINFAEERIEQLERQVEEFQEVDAILIEDCDEGSDKRYGKVLISTENCIQKLYRKAAIASAQEDKG